MKLNVVSVAVDMETMTTDDASKREQVENEPERAKQPGCFVASGASSASVTPSHTVFYCYCLLRLC